MKILAINKAAPLALAVAALAWAGTAQAATDYYLKIDGIDGESKEKPKSRTNNDQQWIDVLSVRLAGDKAAADARPSQIRDSCDDIGPRRDSDSVHSRRCMADDAPPSDPEPAALLLPAVQKVREIAAKIPAWPGCAVGQSLGVVTITEKSTGRTGKILDATVGGCAAEQISLNFTKIEW
jgi:hypothetical protein